MKYCLFFSLLIFVLGCPTDELETEIDVYALSKDTEKETSLSEPDVQPAKDTQKNEPDIQETEDTQDTQRPEADLSVECVTDSDCEELLAPIPACRAPLCEDGECFADALPNGKPCDDGDPCSQGDKCKSGSCSGVVLVCDDGNECTDDYCYPETGACIYEVNAIACDDDNPCTAADTCIFGECQGTLGECPPCKKDSDCASLQDDNLCNGSLHCVNGDCITDESTLVMCSNLELNSCQVAICIPEDGSCSVKNKPSGSPCVPTKTCQGSSICDEGQCVGEALDCDDSNDCTLELCEPGVGCVYTPLKEGDCSDGNACTIGDSCKQGTCVPEAAKDCNDNNSCTADSCIEETGECAYKNIDSACNDGNACTTGDHCEGGACVTELADCNDENECTVDSCNSESGCAWKPLICNDGDACTQDTCNSNTGCVFEKPGLSCSQDSDCADSSVCTQDLCNECGLCEKLPIACEQDDNPCTVSQCNDDEGCVAIPSQVIVCDDNNACTVGDHCEAGLCTSGFLYCDDKNPCTTDSCDPVLSCIYTAIVCDDFNECTKDSCNPNTGCAFDPIECNDGDPCTFEKCDALEGCVYKDKKCWGDDNACTEIACETQTGECITSSVVCNDNNECTADTCNPVSGCAFSDIDCNDMNNCTLDSCNPKSGCINELPGQACNLDSDCNDGLACTDDFCGVCGTCQTKTTVCDDGKECTTDSCDDTQGCQFLASPGLICDTQDECYPEGICDAGGQCQGTANTCGDGTQENPAQSCLQLKNSGQTTSAAYWLKTTDDSQIFQGYCEMTKSGGGWMRVAAIHKDTAVCWYASDVGLQADLLAGGPNTAIMGLSKAGKMPFTTREVMVERYNGYVLFHSANLDWNWTLVAKGAINSQNVADYSVMASHNGDGYVALNPPGFGFLNGPLLLMGVTDDGQMTPALGVGAGYSGSFNQDKKCKNASGFNTGLLGGTMLPPNIWARQGNIYIR